MEPLGPPLDGIRDIWEFFENLSRKLKISLTSDKDEGTLNKDQYTFLLYLTEFFFEWEIFHRKYLQKKSEHTIYVR
jgi:hypothetical protein